MSSSIVSSSSSPLEYESDAVSIASALPLVLVPPIMLLLLLLLLLRPLVVILPSAPVAMISVEGDDTPKLPRARRAYEPHQHAHNEQPTCRHTRTPMPSRYESNGMDLTGIDNGASRAKASFITVSSSS